MTWCWKLVNPLEDHVSVLDLPHGCATTKPFLSPNYQTKLYPEFMNNVEDTKGQRSLSVPEFRRTHEGKYHLFALFFRTSTNSSSVLAHSSWASKAQLTTYRYHKTNWRDKETVIYGYQLSTTLIQIHFQSPSWLWGAPLACQPHTVKLPEGGIEGPSMMREMWDVLHYRKCRVDLCGVLGMAHANGPLVWKDATESHYTLLHLLLFSIHHNPFSK